MRRTRLYQILIWLLCLFPVWSLAQSLTQYEYWIDDNFSARKSAGLSGYEADIDVGIDASRLGNGLHKLCLRVQQSDGMYSPITTHYFFKAQVSNGGKLEYWFDGNRKKINTVDCHVSSDGEAYLYTSGLDLTAVTPGYHTMFYRFTNDDGTTSSAVSVASVIVTSSLSNGGKLEYWFDDDRENVYTVGGKVASTGDALIFNSDLDLKDVSQGMHRMYYRLVDAKGKPNSAVSMTPVLVKSKYNVANTDALTVTEQSYWFDNNEHEIRMVPDPKNIKNLPLSLDTRKLSDGKHTLHLQYGNSADIWNAPVDFSFTKTKVNDPTIVATASVEDGEVTLKFSSVPWGTAYTVVRKYPSGSERNVEVIESSEYPAALKSIDRPSPGNYTYYVEGDYLDADGLIQKVRSSELSVKVDKTAKYGERGTINGVMTFEGKEATRERYYGYTIYVNGQPQGASEYKIRWLRNGHFKIEDVPYGTELTIGIEHIDDYYYFKDQKLIVDETTINNTYCFDGTKDENYDDLPNDDASDLVLTDKIRITPNGWEIPLLNHAKKTWSGNLIVRVISKKIKDKIGKEYSDESKSSLDYLYYNSNICYSTIADMSVDIQGYKEGEQVVMLDITNMPYADKNEDYYVYLYSKKKDSEETKIVEGSDYSPNPQVLKFNPSDYSAISIMNECVEVMKWVRKFADWGDPFKLAWKSSEDAWNNFIEFYDLNKDDVDKKLIEDEFNAYLRSAGLIMNCFYGELTQGIIKSLKNDPLYKATNKITDLYNSIKAVSDAGEGHGANTEAADGHRFFELAKQVLKYVDKGDPVVSIYKTYFEVGQKMIDAIENMTYGIHDHDIWEKIHSGKGVYKIKIRKYTDSKEGLRYFSGKDFYPSTYRTVHNGQIKSISIKLIDPSMNEGMDCYELTEKNVDLVDDGIVVKNVKFPNIAGMGYEDVEAWMTIVWKNNRVTHVPLLNTDFAKIENTNSGKSDEPLTMTVEFQSGSNLHTEGIPNHLTIVNPNKSWLENIFDYLPL